MRPEIRKLQMYVLLAVIFLIVSLMFATTAKEGPKIFNDPPVASFTYDPTNPVASQTITFDASSSYDLDGTISEYAWDFGDDSPGIVDGNEVVPYAYASAGTYVVTLTVWDDKGASGSKSETISVGAAWYPWPMFSHDQQRTGVSDGGMQTTVANLRWTFLVEVPAPSGVWSSPVVGEDGTNYVGSMDNYLYAINPNGIEEWRCYTTQFGRICNAPAISPDGTRIYVCSDESSGIRPNIFAIDTTSGNKLWTAMLGNGLTLPVNDWVGASNPVVIDEGGMPVIYVCGNENYAGKYRLYRIEDHGTSGSMAWWIELPLYIHPQFGAAPPSPAVAEDGTIYVGAKGDSGVPIYGSLYAINPDGTAKWHLQVTSFNFAEAAGCPSIREEGGQEVIYIGATDYRMCKVKENPAQNGGDLVWFYTNPYNEASGASAAIADLNVDGDVDVILTSSAMNIGHVFAITDMGNDWGDGVTTGVELWITTIPGAIVSTPALGYTPVAPPYQYKVFLGSCNRGIYTLAGWDGSILAEYTTGFSLLGVTSSPAVAQPRTAPSGAPGWIFVGSNDGKLYAFGPDSTSPATVTDLATSASTTNSITLTWTAPGDDGNTGTASEYDIRYSTSPITVANWNAATQCIGEPAPQPAGSSETFTVTHLFPGGTTYYVALKTADDVSNWSPLSNVASGMTLPKLSPIPIPIPRPIS
jgi:PKD repeat protein